MLKYDILMTYYWMNDRLIVLCSCIWLWYFDDDQYGY